MPILFFYVPLQKISIMAKDFYQFRKWFNKRFSLSFNGKFKSVTFLAIESKHLYELFLHKLTRLFSKSFNGRYQPASSDVIVLRVCGNTIKLYSK